MTKKTLFAKFYLNDHNWQGKHAVRDGIWFNVDSDQCKIPIWWPFQKFKTRLCYFQIFSIAYIAPQRRFGKAIWVTRDDEYRVCSGWPRSWILMGSCQKSSPTVSQWGRKLDYEAFHVLCHQTRGSRIFVRIFNQ